MHELWERGPGLFGAEGRLVLGGGYGLDKRWGVHWGVGGADDSGSCSYHWRREVELRPVGVYQIRGGRG